MTIKINNIGVSFNTPGVASVDAAFDLTPPLSAQDRADLAAAIAAALADARASRVDGIKAGLVDLTRAEKDAIAAEAAK